VLDKVPKGENAQLFLEQFRPLGAYAIEGFDFGVEKRRHRVLSSKHWRER
jgi:hypothetical protein